MSRSRAISSVSSIPGGPHDIGSEPNQSNPTGELQYGMDNLENFNIANDSRTRLTLATVMPKGSPSQEVEKRFNNFEESKSNQDIHRLPSTPSEFGQHSIHHSVHKTSPQANRLPNENSSSESLTGETTSNTTAQIASQTQLSKSRISRTGHNLENTSIPFPSSQTSHKQPRRYAAFDKQAEAYSSSKQDQGQKTNVQTFNNLSADDNMYDSHDEDESEIEDVTDDEDISYESEDLAATSYFPDDELSDSYVVDVPTTSLSTITEISETSRSEHVVVYNGPQAALNTLGQRFVTQEPVPSSSQTVPEPLALTKPTTLASEALVNLSISSKPDCTETPPETSVDSSHQHDFVDENPAKGAPEYDVNYVNIVPSPAISLESNNGSHVLNRHQVTESDGPINDKDNDRGSVVMAPSVSSVIENSTPSASDHTFQPSDQMTVDAHHESQDHPVS